MATRKKTAIRYLYEWFMKLQPWITNYPTKKPLIPVGLTPEAVVWAYRLFLDREPENQQVVDYKLRNFNNIHRLRQEFMYSLEFRQNNPAFHSPALSGDEPPMLIESIILHLDHAWIMDVDLAA